MNARRLLLLVAFAAAALRGQPGHEDHGHALPAAPDTGWTAQGGAATPADSLAAFRPDSLKDEVIKSAESAPSPFAGRATPKDSADSVAALLRGRRPALSIHAGINFLDLDAKEIFQAALEARRARDSLVVLQPYEPVHLAFPIGIQAVIPVGPWFDLVAKTHSFWYQQTAVLGRGGRTSGEESFAVQAHLGGAGLRYYIPPDLLSVTGSLGLFVQGVYYWLLGGGELYTTRGAVPAEFDPAGSAWEIQLGFNQAVKRSWGLTGSIGFLQQEYASERLWTDLVADKAPAGKVTWGAGALQASFNLWYHFGVTSQAAAPPAPVPAGNPVQPAPGPVPPAD